MQIAFDDDIVTIERTDPSLCDFHLRRFEFECVAAYPLLSIKAPIGTCSLPNGAGPLAMPV